MGTRLQNRVGFVIDGPLNILLPYQSPTMTTRTHNNNGDAYLLQHKDLAEFIPDLLFSETHNFFTIASKKNLQCNLFSSWD